jgi:hypothetical protein
MYFILTYGIFETDAYGVPSKSQNPTVLVQVGLSSTQRSSHKVERTEGASA